MSLIEVTGGEENARQDPLVDGNTTFALDLYQQLRSKQGNLFFSPYSISSALAMTLAGARERTLEQMIQTLRLPPDAEEIHARFKELAGRLTEIGENSGSQLKIANALWPQKGYRLARKFTNLVRKAYGVRIKALDYADGEAARAVINEWVDEKTESKIQDLIGPGVLDSLTRLVLVNAIFFKGTWEHTFDPGQTTEEAFTPAIGEEVMAKMMRQKDSFRYGETDDLQIIELPYSGKELSMLVLLPKAVDGLARLEETLTTENLAGWMGALAETEVRVWLPAFEISFPFRLDETLIALGMTDAFTGKADFSGMEKTRELYLGAVLHKAFVAVNEEGTEAAAATAVVMQTKSIEFMSVEFRADHPFLFLIRENHTGTILFIGRLVNPEETG